MRKLIWTLVVVAVVAIFGGRAWYLYQNRDTNVNTIKIGAILPMSGVYGEEGKDVLACLKIATEDFNKANPQTPVKLLLEDGKYTSQATISAFHKLQGESVKYFVVYGDNPSYVLAPMTKENDVVIMGIAAADNVTQLSDKVFRAWISTGYSTKALANFLSNDLKIQSTAVMRINNNYGKEGADGFTKAYQENGGKIVIQETYPQDVRDVRSYVAKVLDKNPDSIVVFGFGSGLAAVINQIMETGYNKPILSETAISFPNTYEHVANNAAGVYFVEPIIDTKYPGYADFSAKYKAQREKTAVAIQGFSYEALRLLAQSILAQKNTNVADVSKGLSNLSNVPTMVGTFGYDGGREAHAPLAIKQMQADGTAKVVKE